MSAAFFLWKGVNSMRTAFVLVALLICGATVAKAADIACLGMGIVEKHGTAPNWTGLMVGRWGDRDPDDDASQLCHSIALIGPINTGDAEKLEEAIGEAKSGTITLHLLSQGGSLTEGMKIGRLLRQKFIETTARPHQLYSQPRTSPMTLDEAEAILSGKTDEKAKTDRKAFSPPKRVPARQCGNAGEPVCCASACALAFLGGARWDIFSVVGMHRPTIKDLGNVPFNEAAATLRKSMEDVRSYLLEMGADNRFLSAMERASPEQIINVPVHPTPLKTDHSYRYPPIVFDWLSARCRAKGARDSDSLGNCFNDEFWNEQDAARYR
jgi:hypothetical protein